MATQLGCTVAELDRRISSHELTEWMAFERIEGPLGPRRSDFHAAQIVAAIAQSNAKKGKRYKLSDFLLAWDRRKPHQSPQEMLRAVKALNRRMGGREVVTGGDGA